MIRVLVVDDVATDRAVLAGILESDPGITVVGRLRDGREAVDYLTHNQPDVVVMDVNMPRLGGIEATHRIMETHAIPVILVTATSDVGDLMAASREAGAVLILPKPTALHQPDHAYLSEGLVEAVKLMAEVKVVTRRTRRRLHGIEHTPTPYLADRHKLGVEPEVMAIGASTGGPIVLQQLLSALPNNFPIPTLIVQHISTGFIDSLVRWLSTSIPFPLHIASDGEQMLPGHVYFAPDDAHLGFSRRGTLSIIDAPPEDGLRPSANFLLRAAAQTYGATAIGVVLTGMGRDGAEGLKAIHDCGGPTFAQDEASSVVYGMPHEAVKIGAATYVLPPKQIARQVAKLLSVTKD